MSSSFTTIRRGEKSSAVLAIQKIGKEQGFFSGQLDSDYGPITEDFVARWEMTHNGPDGSALVVNGKDVNAATWWSLQNPTVSARGAAGSSAVTRSNDKLLTELRVVEPRAILLDVALSEWKRGVVEKPKGSNWGGQVSEYLKSAGIGANPWCAAYVSYCHRTSGLWAKRWPSGAADVSVKSIYDKANANGKFFAKGAYIPRPGDEMIMLYRNTKGRFTGSGHIGFVLSVSADGKSFSCLEGNSGDALKLVTRKMSESTIEGFVNHFEDAKKPYVYKRMLVATSDIDDGKTR